MKLNKWGLGILTILSIFLLGGCWNDPRTEFIEALSNAGSSAAEASKFELSVADFDYAGGDTDSDLYISMFASQLKAISLKGTFASDEDKEVSETELALGAYGQKIPFQFVTEKENMYVSTSFISGALDIADMFQYPVTIDEDELQKLDGKFINIDNIKDQLDGEDEDEKDTDSNVGFNFSLMKKAKELMDIFDKESFTKKDDVISHTFTKKEILAVMEAMKDYAKEEKDKESQKTFEESITALKSSFKDLKIKVSVNQKTNKINSTITMSYLYDATAAKFDVSLKLTITPQKKTGKIKVPGKKDILSEEKFDEILNSIFTVEEEEEVDLDTYKDIYGDDEYMDEYLEDLIAEIEASPELFSEEEVNSIRENGPLVFNKDQMKRLNEALDKALL
ncbi:hypothetical protein [Candidatus Enterococcus clewellii]|uniref:Lipoprotein n=1 Tax=Candidatus Enterococcus clewellii TaxID=1834193 RepID=A0A242K572_9ENTE|nr:hypothetical protein [Enterococcus sp. 9E7_DIV0242]OTP14668.1 hypothetical protein A5888_002769 [Enterococcus sp. 9E7_DIV0242]